MLKESFVPAEKLCEKEGEMRITFLVPPVLAGKRATERVAGCTYTLYFVPNIYELTVCAVLRDAGHRIGYVESVLMGWKRRQFEQFLSSDTSDAYSIYTVNLGIENDLEAIKLIRRYRPHVPVVFMGPAPTQFPERFLVDENTYVVRGEPELTTAELFWTLESGGSLEGVRGISYIDSTGGIRHNGFRPLIEDLDFLPFPARDLVPPRLRAKYSNPKLKCSPYTAAVTTRNCPFRCIYCVPSSLSFARELEYKRHFNKKPPVKMRSVDNVIQELEELKAQGYRSLSFQDDNFTWTEERTVAISEALGRLGFVWGCQSRSDLLTERAAEAMARNGCRYVDLGVESFDQRVLDFIKKGVTVEDQIRAIRTLKRCGISAKINVLLGTSPLETVDTIRRNMEMIRKLDVDQVMFSIVAPFPGTEFYEMAKQNGWFVYGDYRPVDVQKRSIISYPHLSARDLERACRRANYQFFLSPRFIRKHIDKFASPRDFWIAAKALYRKLFAGA